MDNEYKLARRRMGMTQAHLAQAACVSESTVRRAERGQSIGPEVSRALCSVLEMDVRDLQRQSSMIPETIHVRTGMTLLELKVRIFFRELFAWIGGMHPLVMVPFLLMFIPPGVGTPVFSIWLIAALAWPPMMYGFARWAGRSHREAVQFLQGAVFLTGETVDLGARIEELRSSEQANQPVPS
jgi:DNA-binding XRE family transcriptional regulator